MRHELLALLGGRVVGRVKQTATGEYRFRYTEAWRDQAHAIPLSLSLPLTRLDHWERLAAEIGARRDEVVALVREIVEQTPDHLRDVCREAAENGAGHPVLARLQDAVAANARACLKRLASPAPT